MNITILLIAVAAIWIIWRYKKVAGPKKRGPARTATKTAPTLSQNFRWPAMGDFEFEVVGESHYQVNLRRLAGDYGNESASTECVAELVPEDDNKFDKSAVCVYVKDQMVGYLSREDARSFRRRLGRKGLSGQNTFCDAVIVGGGTAKDGKEFKYGIRLDIKPFDN